MGMIRGKQRRKKDRENEEEAMKKWIEVRWGANEEEDEETDMGYIGGDEEKEEEDEREIANCVHMQAAAKSQTCL